LSREGSRGREQYHDASLVPSAAGRAALLARNSPVWCDFGRVFVMGIFGLFGKKPPTMMDGLVQSIYGNKPRKKQADLSEASRIAYEELLCEIIDYSDVHVLAKKLFDGPMPYSTHDLAISVSLNFFKDANLFDDLKEAQIAARLQLLNWIREGKVAVPLAQAFEEVLYKLYKPILAASAPTSDTQTPKVDESVSSEYDEFLASLREANKGATPQGAAKTVRDVMVWQHNCLAGSKLDSDYVPKAGAVDIEKAFFFGLAAMALEVYDLPSSNALFVKNVVGGYYAIMDSDEISSRYDEMQNAAEVHDAAFKLGLDLMVEKLASGKDENRRYLLTELIRDFAED
jgi:hypothetical protein